MSNYKESFRFSDLSVRLIEERDIAAVINLYKLNYGDNYTYPQFYDERWIKRGIYNDHIITIVIHEENNILASGALVLDVGSHKDQIGELGRVVVHPNYKGKHLGQRIVNALTEIANDTVEFAIGETRTEFSAPQKLVDNANFASIGFLPNHLGFGITRESLILYGKLSEIGLLLRSQETPQLIPEVVSLAIHSLSKLKLPTDFSIIEDCKPYSFDSNVIVKPIELSSFPKLLRIEHGRLIKPLLFGNGSLEYGISTLRRSGAHYLITMNKAEEPTGAIGFTVDWANRWVKGIELIAESNDLLGTLCKSFSNLSKEELKAEGIEVNVSAYDARIQQTFFDLGFRPVAYAPAMVFHGTKRLDIIKMLKLNIPYNPIEMKLTDSAREVVSIVESGFK